MKIGFIFAGQGQQFLNMGKDLVATYPVAKSLYKQAKDILEYDVLDLSQEQLNSTEFTQPALFVLGVVLDTLLKDNGIKPEVVCGLSLGEYNALYSSGVIGFDEGLRLVSKRAVIMNKAFEPFSTAMAACLRTDWDTVESLIADTGIEVCNYNTLSQVVIGGRVEDLDRLLPKLKENKILAIKLKVSTVSHMSLLEDASLRLRDALSLLSYAKPKIDFINNIAGVVQVDGFVETLSNHISSPTYLSKSIMLMRDLGVNHFIEVGPKGSLSKFVKEIVDGVVVDNVYDVSTLVEVLSE